MRSPSHADDAELLPPRFAVHARVGEGGFGVVYDAFDRERRARVAVKTLRSATVEHLLALRNEFRAAQHLDHRNLVRLGELLENEGRWCFTMEFVEGQDFVRYVRRDTFETDSSQSGARPRVEPADVESEGTTQAAHPAPASRPSFDERRLRLALKQVVRGLRALHGAGILHRDLKPSNVLVTREGRAVILDFGLAVLESHAALEQDGPLGTPYFASPEQAAREAVGPASDWYSLGVMLFQALTGRLPFEGNAFEVLTAKLTREAPSPREIVPDLPADLVALCEGLLRIDPLERPSPADVLRAVGEDEGQDEAPRSEIFVGRSAELEQLWSAMRVVVDGGSACAVIRGQSGVGKSCLVETFLERVKSEVPGALVLAGRCYEREFVPYKAIDGVVDELVRHLRERTEEDRQRLLPSGLDELARLFPQLVRLRRTSFGSEEPVSRRLDNAREIRRLAFLASRRLFAALGREHHLVVVIDDIQWADNDSLEFLAEILRGEDGPRLLLLFTERVGGTTERRALEEVLPVEVRTLSLEPLAEEDARRLAEALLGESGASVVDVAQVAQESGGHPLFIDELVRQRSRIRESGAPLRLDDVLVDRAQRLDESARAVLEVVCLAGVPVDQAAAALAAQIDMGRLLGTVAELRAARLVRAAGERKPGAIEVYHDRVREAVVARLDESTRVNLHRRIASVLSGSDDVDPETLAVHWLGAGKRERAAEYVLAAADQATQVLAFDRAAHLYRRALELGPPGEEHRRHVQRKLVEALTNAGREAEAADVRLELARSMERTQALDEKRRAAEQLLRSGRHERGVALLREVLTASGLRYPESPLALVLSLLFTRLLLAVRGLKLHSPPGGPTALLALRVDAARSAGSGFSLSDNIRGAYFQSEALLHALGTGDKARVQYALCMEICFVSVGGSKAKRRVDTKLVTAERLAREVGTPEALGMLHTARGYGAYFTGEWSKAKEDLNVAEQLFRDHCLAYVFESNAVRYTLYRALVFRGDLKELRERVDVALKDAIDRSDVLSQVNFRCIGSALLTLAADDPAQSRAELAAAREHLSGAKFLVQHFAHLVGEVQADLYTGEGATAYERIVAARGPLRRALLHRIESLRVTLADLTARAALSAAATRVGTERALWLARAADACRALEHERPAWAHALAKLARAGITAAQDGDLRGAVAYEAAAKALDAVDMRIYAACARRRAGELTGGEDGVAQARAADHVLAAEGVRNPARMAGVYTPLADR